jgi:hypothetical protein
MEAEVEKLLLPLVFLLIISPSPLTCDLVGLTYSVVHVIAARLIPPLPPDQPARDLPSTAAAGGGRQQESRGDDLEAGSQPDLASFSRCVVLALIVIFHYPY